MKKMNEKEYAWALCETPTNSDGWYDDHVLLGIFTYNNSTCAMWWDKYGERMVFFNASGILEIYSNEVKDETTAQEIFGKCSNARTAP